METIMRGLTARLCASGNALGLGFLHPATTAFLRCPAGIMAACLRARRAVPRGIAQIDRVWAGQSADRQSTKAADKRTFAGVAGQRANRCSGARAQQSSRK